eukprot:8165982-Pyramimonas_sp.AAC.1
MHATRGIKSVPLEPGSAQNFVGSGAACAPALRATVIARRRRTRVDCDSGPFFLTLVGTHAGAAMAVRGGR